MKLITFKVCGFITLIDPSLPRSIKFVKQYKSKRVVYDIEMHTIYDSQAIRDAYGLFYRKKSGRRLPDSLKGISLSNVTTFATRVRVRLLKELCHRHQAANPTVSCFVTGYLPRPELKIRDRKGPITSYTYTQAIQKLSHHLTQDFLKELYHFARTNLPESEVAEKFLILSSDLLCTSPEDPNSMSIDEGQVAPPPVIGAAFPPNQPTPPLVQPPPLALVPTVNTSSPLGQTTSTPPHAQLPSTAPPFAVPSTSAHIPPLVQFSPGPGLQPDHRTVQASTPAVATPASASGTEDGFILVERRGRTRFSKQSGPYGVPT
jgi:hypothetical protein